jgi:23S rRNA (uracil1939-C5)-methyltransferase
MTSSQQISEKSYQQLKQENLQKTLGDYCQNADWIWVGPHSRRKVSFQIDARNNLGFFAEKSNNLIEIEEDLLAEKEISALIPALKKFLKSQEEGIFTQASITLFDSGLDLIFNVKKSLGFSQMQKLTSFAKTENFNVSYRIKNDTTPVFVIRKNQIFYPDFKIDLDSDVFIQATKLGLQSIIKIIRNFLEQNKNIKNVSDIYAGFGAYSFAIQDLVKSILAFEGDQKMVDLINKNASSNNLAKVKAEIRDLYCDPISKKELGKFDLAIINPPRNGASPQITEIAKSVIKNVIYVSCNPESFKRDAKILIDSGFKIINLIALDQFYSTKHLELIAIIQKNG